MEDISDIINQEPSEEEKIEIKLLAYMLINEKDLEKLGKKSVFQENKESCKRVYLKAQNIPGYHEYFMATLEWLLDRCLREDPSAYWRLEKNLPIFESWYDTPQ